MKLKRHTTVRADHLQRHRHGRQTQQRGAQQFVACDRCGQRRVETRTVKWAVDVRHALRVIGAGRSPVLQAPQPGLLR